MMSNRAIDYTLTEIKKYRDCIFEIEGWLSTREGACEVMLKESHIKLYGISKAKVRDAKKELAFINQLQEFIKEQKTKTKGN